MPIQTANSLHTGNVQLELRKFVAPEYIFGADARLLASNYCKQLGGIKVLLVTDSGVMTTPWLAELQENLFRNGIEHTLYSSISPNPRDFEVMEGADFYRASGCNMIIALGGGSVMDCAKGIGIVSTNHKHIDRFEGVDKIANPMPPLICIPTTAGTAADLSQFAIINRYEHKYKMAIISKATVPDVSLIDPVVLTTMDSFLTACTGMDALAHAFEAYVSNASSAFTDLYALEAIDLLTANLLASIQNPTDIQLRGRVMLASIYAGLAFSNASLGCVHSLAHSLGGYLDLPHGECNAILLPHVVDYYFDVAQDKYITIAHKLGVDASGLTPTSVKKLLVDSILYLKRSVGIVSTLGNKGVKSDMVSTLSGKAINDPCNATNPRVPTKADLAAIYSEAI
ncbi:MAG: alcohol dehydrogenase-like regulatory protein ErcA [Tenuifilaceae bacterium]|jgi:alcohol dehydrogenase class IV|nr:alcohol dehydrogenase-like regulatory protein ErcA [Tenuifilaceae bacterium]